MNPLIEAAGLSLNSGSVGGNAEFTGMLTVFGCIISTSIADYFMPSY